MITILWLVGLQESPNDEAGIMKAVKSVHAMIDTEISSGTEPENIFICGFSQGGKQHSLFFFLPGIK